jgi:hypothetical protein
MSRDQNGVNPPTKRTVVNCRFERYDVYVGLPSEWGNEYSHKPGTKAKYRTKTIEEATYRHAIDFLSDHAKVEKCRRELKGKVLGCSCVCPDRPDASCHAHIYARVANATEEELVKIYRDYDFEFDGEKWTAEYINNAFFEES